MPKDVDRKHGFRRRVKDKIAVTGANLSFVLAVAMLASCAPRCPSPNLEAWRSVPPTCAVEYDEMAHIRASWCAVP